MKFPRINKQAMRAVSIPQLSGGMNLRDSVTMIQDNQLTDAKNMWFKDAILKTRPGLQTNSNMKFTVAMLEDIAGGHPTDINFTKDGKLYLLFYYEVSGQQHSSETYDTLINTTVSGFFWVSDSDIIPLPQLSAPVSFATRYKDKIYAFLNNQKIYTMTIDADESNPQWAMLTDADLYAPLIITGCKPDGSLLMNQDEMGGTLMEGYNLIGDRYRMIYSTVNKALLNLSDSASNHAMIYSLLDSAHRAGNIGKTVQAVITDVNGVKYTHRVTTTANKQWDVEQTSPGDGLYLGVFGRSLWFFKGNTTQAGVAYIGASSYVEDNLEITAPCVNSSDNLKKVFDMKRPIWFGGDAAGISGGSRLFLGGNENEDEKSLVLWSGLNNPLYFPENCYAYVGNSTQAVTAFGRQSDMLVIFKERETFATQYVKASGITASDLINQNVVDYTASNVYFPMVQLHSGIGCSCPDTVGLCRNRLVWACTDGNVYTLCSENQYSERNIYCVSDMVRRKLKEETASTLKNAFSADWEGHYFLFADNRVYVMDYESYGYIHIDTFSKTEDAQLRIPWWYWELPGSESIILCSAFVVGDNLLCVYFDRDGYMSDYFVCKFSETAGQDTDKNGGPIPISCEMQTKIFDFGTPAYQKNVPLVNVSFGNNGGVPITVSFNTETAARADEETVELTESGAPGYSNEYVHNRQFRPCMRLINRIGIHISCDGNMAVDAISLNYRLLGGAR